MKFKNDDYYEDSSERSMVQATFWQFVATVSVWVLAVSAVLGSLAIAGQAMGEEIIGIVFLCLAAAVVTSGFIWKWGQVPGQESEDERKAKQKNDSRYENLMLENELLRRQSVAADSRDDIAHALRRLSNQELMTLRDRLARGEISEDELAIALQQSGSRYE